MAENNTDKMTVTLYYQYIMHDIDQWTFRLARMRVADDEKRAEAQSGNDTTDVPYYRRKIVEAIANVRSILKNRLASKPTEGSDTLSTSASGWKIELKIASYDCDATTLAELIHKYVVRSVVADWSLTYAPDATQTVVQEKQNAENEIMAEVYNRKRPLVADNNLTSEDIVAIS